MEIVKPKVHPATAGQKSKNSFEEETPHWLDENHVNYSRWKRARDLSIEKGEVVERILSQNINLENLKILDLGCGNGGTSMVLSKNNFVISLEIDLLKLKSQNIKSQKLINANALELPFKDLSFDVVILQDVIEHIIEPEKLINSCNKILKKNGILYFSTPNRFSILNILSDPHWGLPLVALFKRNFIRKYFLRFFRKMDVNRNDIAQLFSLNQIKFLLGKDFILRLNTKNIVNQLMNGEKGIVWSNFHLFLLKIINSLNLKKLFLNLPNNKFGIVNKFLTPTFYITANKRN